MPYIIRKTKSGKYQVITKGTNHVHGTHSSKKAAVQQLRAIYANTGGE